MMMELIRAMQRTHAASGSKVKRIQLHRSHYDELVNEMKASGMLHYDADGMVSELNGATIEVV